VTRRESTGPRARLARPTSRLAPSSAASPSRLGCCSLRRVAKLQAGKGVPVRLQPLRGEDERHRRHDVLCRAPHQCLLFPGQVQRETSGHRQFDSPERLGIGETPTEGRQLSRLGLHDSPPETTLFAWPRPPTKGAAVDRPQPSPAIPAPLPRPGDRMASSGRPRGGRGSVLPRRPAGQSVCCGGHQGEGPRNFGSSLRLKDPQDIGLLELIPHLLERQR